LSSDRFGESKVLKRHRQNPTRLQIVGINRGRRFTSFLKTETKASESGKEPAGVAETGETTKISPHKQIRLENTKDTTNSTR